MSGIGRNITLYMTDVLGEIVPSVSIISGNLVLSIISGSMRSHGDNWSSIIRTSGTALSEGPSAAQADVIVLSTSGQVSICIIGDNLSSIKRKIVLRIIPRISVIL